MEHGWILGTLLPFGLSGLFVGAAYVAWQHIRQSQSFFTTRCGRWLLLFQAIYASIAFGVGYEVRTVFDEMVYWVTVFFITLLAAIVHWFIFDGAHHRARKYHSQKRQQGLAQ